MENICKTCGRTYRFPACEFCEREKVWNNRPIESHLKNYFTPRMLQEFQENNSASLSKYVNELADGMEAKKGAGVYIWNTSPRTGKTILAMFLFIELLKRAYINNTSSDFIFTTIGEILENERKYKDMRYANFNKPIMVLDPVQQVAHAALLVLDDFGVEKGLYTPANYESIYKVINHRYEYLLPTIFTSNCALGELVSTINDVRVPSRIGRMCSKIVQFHYKELKGQTIWKNQISL